MIKSKYLTNPQTWEERIAVMESNLQNGYYDYLYFNIVLNLNDARDNADYDKEKMFKRILEAFKANDFMAVGNFIGRMKAL